MVEEGDLMDTEALLKEDRTFVPVRFVSEGLGARVSRTAVSSLCDTREKGSTKDDTPKDGSIIEVDGYLVPNDTNIIIVKPRGSDTIETSLSVTTLLPN